MINNYWIYFVEDKYSFIKNILNKLRFVSVKNCLKYIFFIQNCMKLSLEDLFEILNKKYVF